MEKFSQGPCPTHDLGPLDEGDGECHLFDWGVEPWDVEVEKEVVV